MTKQLEIKRPDFLKGEGFDESAINIDIKDRKMSELKIIQEQGEFELGDYIDSVTKKNYGQQVEIIILKHEKNWLSFNDEFELDKISYDGKYWDDGKAMTEEEGWQSLYHKFYILIKDDLTPIPLFLSFGKTSAKGGKLLLNFLDRFTRTYKEPTYARIYTLSSQECKKGTKAYCIKTVVPGEFVTKEQYNHAKEVYALIKNTNEATKPEQVQLD